VAGITKPLLTWQVTVGFLSKNTDDKLLGKIWRALGFTIDAPGRPAGDEDGKEKAAGVVWDRACVETALLVGLGYTRVRPYEEPPHSRRWMIAAQDGRQPCVTKWLRQAERFLQRVPPHATPRVCVCGVCVVCDWRDCCQGRILIMMILCGRFRKLCLMTPMASSPTTSTRSW
jgi:hypothetical protein